MKYCIIDLETTIKESFKRKANPFDPANKIVYIGQRIQDGEIKLFKDIIFEFSEDLCYVGHNIKFDLLHLYTIATNKPHQIWDTQLAEYILTGYETKMCGLRDIAVKKYGCPYREKRMEMFWKEGTCTSKIPDVIVREDLYGDLLDTEQVFLQQVKKAKELGLIKFIKLMMESLLVTTEMEHNGIFIDRNLLEDLRRCKEIELDQLEKTINDDLSQYWTLPVQLNLNSNDHKSLLLFGGHLTCAKKEQVGICKNGNPKMRLVEKSYSQRGIDPNADKEPVAKEGFYKVDESVLNSLTHPSVKSLVLYNKMARDYNTYYNGLSELVNPVDNCIHHKLLHVTTQTGRLSGRDPNMQNIPRSDKSEIKKVFTSRYQGGILCEFDYSQIEIRVAACVYNDSTLLKELRTGIDIYKVNAMWFYNISEKEVTKEQRQIVKGFILGILYGKGAKSLSEESEMDKDACRDFIESFYNKYTGIKQGHTLIQDAAEREKIASSYFTVGGHRADIFKYKTLVGNILTFIEHKAPDFIIDKTGKETSFSPPDLKNWPIQSLAGVILCCMLPKVQRYLEYNGHGVLVNTVHDSIIVDYDNNEGDRKAFMDEIAGTLEQVPQMMKDNFGIVWDLEFPVEVKFGSNWYDC